MGAPGEAELLGLDGLLPVTERRRGGESGVRSVVAFLGDAVWEAGGAGRWPRGLLGAALSRSDSPQGDALADGRTQDLVGLGLVPRLARDPAAYAIEHSDGLRSCVLVLNGVVNDLNFAIGLKDGGEVSAQLYRPPAPASHCFSALAEVVDEFFETGIPPWPAERAVLVAGLLDAFRRARARPGDRLETPELSIAYKAPERSAFRRA
ncbi:MAG: hypothetical protein HY721_18685 [Planctomycetes bacterium]|nr:hypothetical protein [Planctomycetota bacterium]